MNTEKFTNIQTKEEKTTNKNLDRLSPQGETVQNASKLTRTENFDTSEQLKTQSMDDTTLTSEIQKCIKTKLNQSDVKQTDDTDFNQARVEGQQKETKATRIDELANKSQAWDGCQQAKNLAEPIGNLAKNQAAGELQTSTAQCESKSQNKTSSKHHGKAHHGLAEHEREDTPMLYPGELFVANLDGDQEATQSKTETVCGINTMASGQHCTKARHHKNKGEHEAMLFPGDVAVANLDHDQADDHHRSKKEKTCSDECKEGAKDSCQQAKQFAEPIGNLAKNQAADSQEDKVDL